MGRKTILITFENVSVDKVVKTLNNEGIIVLGGTAESVLIDTTRHEYALASMIHRINGGAWCKVEDISDDEILIDSFL
ncbi:hypothetical protein [Vibrio phage vB_VpS_PG28]|nr:hypothetical protein [Vibrio phage vB_VpS_PG28]